ncbi:hypothetical protein O6H91_03G102200 [Diphasiastrum complanatum]|uniref:Uncharacterized protein n=1 Tax=Diphasiastrum complanatum TaxID=34168 RepID=A0ACC2E9T9_DIPCM|nr:hypothetical protein O6H91_03G102200 [Diphasiastrum complanatum]
MAAAAAAEAVLSSIKPVSSLASAASALTDEQLSILQFLCNKNLERAMRILDLGGVERVVAEPSKRTVFRVLGESKGCDQYVCFPKHFCSCHSFFYDVVARGEQLHVI